MHNEKARSKAMTIAVAVPGVAAVSIGENDQLVVIGEGVDFVCLAKSLRKKFCFADIVSVEDVKPPDSSGPSSPNSSPPQPTPAQYCPPVYYETRVVYDASPPNCTIL
ncbi:heavy metal-associated isoprenylated plant protein 47-like [Salvia divinorum]